MMQLWPIVIGIVVIVTFAEACAPVCFLFRSVDRHHSYPPPFWSLLYSLNPPVHSCINRSHKEEKEAKAREAKEREARAKARVGKPPPTGPTSR